MKRIMMISITTLLLLISISSHSKAAVSRAGVLFLRIAAGARAAGMGESFVAIADDATATHWNPAGLGFYPLSPLWIEISTEPGDELKEMALTRNDFPGENYRKYDVWARTESDLLKWDGNRWLSYFVHFTSTAEGLQQIVEKYLRTNDKTDFQQRMRMVAQLNISVSRDSLEYLEQRIEQSLPSDYEFMRSTQQTWQDLLEAWDKCLIDDYKVSQLLKLAEQCFSDGILTIDESNQISLAVDRVITKNLRQNLKIPYKAILLDEINCLGYSDKDLWVGTKKGLYRYENNIWTLLRKEDGLPGNVVNCIAVSSSQTVWVGTDSGVVKFGGRKWTSVPFDSSEVDQSVTKIAVRGDSEVWAATTKELYRYDGRSWTKDDKYIIKPGDSLEKIAQIYLGFEDEVRLSQVVENIVQYNSLVNDTLNPGEVIRLPYHLGLGSEITCLTIDNKGSLWVGTKWGIRRYANQRWNDFGYTLYVVQPGENTRNIAEKFLPSGSQEKIEKLTQRIIDYNRLGSSELKAGQKIYIYTSITGSEILKITSSEGYDIYVGTKYGTLFFDGEAWVRYYHSGLEKTKTNDILFEDEEMWFAAENKLVIYAHAKKEATAMYANWLPELASDLYYAFFSYTQHMEGWGTLGGNFTLLSLGKNVRTGEMADTLGVFSSYEAAFTFSYGTKLSERVSAGISTKLIYSHLSDQGAGKERGTGSGSSIALDAGILYNTPIKNLTLGAALTNVGPDISYIDADQADPLPRNLAIGAAYKVIDTPYNRLLATFEVNKELLDARYWGRVKEAVENMGLEYWYGNSIALRAGYINDKEGEIQTPTFGAGLAYNMFKFDFAYIPSSEDLALSNTMRFSISGRF